MLRRLLEARFAGVRRTAAEVVEGLDDRSRLFVMELAVEQKRLARLAVCSLAALIVSALATVWAAATLVAFTWDTQWRHATLLALLALWVVGAVALCVKAKSLLEAVSDPFPLSRQVMTDDLAQAREALR